MLYAHHLAEDGGDGIAGLAVPGLTHGDPDRLGAARVGHHADRHRLPYGLAEKAQDLGFGAQCVHVVGIAALQNSPGTVEQGLVQGIPAHGDGGAGENGILVHGSVISHVLPIGPFGLDIAALVQKALEHHFGVGRNLDVVGHALDQRHRLAAERADLLDLVARPPHARAHLVQRVGADGERDGQLFAACNHFFVDALEVRRRGDVGARLELVAKTQPPGTHIRVARVRVDGVIDAAGQIHAAVELVLGMKRQLREVHVVAGDNHFMDRRFVRRHLDNRLLVGDPAEKLVGHRVRCRIERRGETPASAANRGGDLEMLRSRILEQDTLVGRLDYGTHVRQRHRFVMHIDLAHVDQSLDEPAQAELVKIHFGTDGCVGHRVFLPYAGFRTGRLSDTMNPTCLPVKRPA